MTAAAPLVSVLTPVYNGEQYLAACIDSVRAQTYSTWEYVVVDNASTDRTREIAERYAARDPRIRVVSNPRLVGVIENHNIAFRQASAASAYCKVVHADDLLFPECLAAMVELAEAHPSVGIVSAYRLQGDWLDLDGLPYPSPVTPGRTICRWSLLGFPYVFGSPTSHMIRTGLVRTRDPFYDESSIHADEAACYDVLASSDFGFVHQLLTLSRVHAGTVTSSVAQRLNTYLAGGLAILQKYGPIYLTPSEYERRHRERLAQYYKYLAQVAVTGRNSEVWAYHRRALARLGHAFSWMALLRAFALHTTRIALSPGTDLPKVVQALRRGSGRPVTAEPWSDALDRARMHAFVKSIERADAARVRDGAPNGVLETVPPSPPDPVAERSAISSSGA